MANVEQVRQIPQQPRAGASAAANLSFEIEVQNRFLQFLENFEIFNESDAQGSSRGAGVKIYLQELTDMVQNERQVLDVNYDHINRYDNPLVEQAIEPFFYRVMPFLQRSLKEFVRKHFPDSVVGENGMDREFQVAFFNLPATIHLRELRSDHIGKLLCVSATVTRTGDVRPELLSGTFMCLDCRTIIENVEQQFRYTTPTVCTNINCGNRTKWQLMMDRSRFVDFQRIRVQEASSEIPAGSMPRTMDVVIRGEGVDRAKPGDAVRITGSLIVVPDIAQISAPGDRTEMVRESGGRSGFGGEGVTGIRALGVKELNYRLALQANNVEVPEDDSGELDFGPAEQDKMARLAKQPDLYQRMVESVCPAVFGHVEIKKGILLQLLGGVQKQTTEGIKLRGDINICMIGDPSTAKSQFLKYISSFLPRAVYTSGKASSAAGLTASVIKDPETGEFGVEAGALMLADNGVCCIDEFDKMDIKDQVAIHEAMEQQTISVAKAGIQATLNARTSILAAANPKNGRYDKAKPLRQNVDITAPIMSRFDLFFVLIDECNDAVDAAIARHLVDVHRRRAAAVTRDFSTEDLQRYIRFAKTIKPVMNQEAATKLVQYYTELRQNDAHGAYQNSYRVTVRQLESMVRLSEALARLHCDSEVRAKYVTEAFKLLKTSIITVDAGELTLEEEEFIAAVEEQQQQAQSGDTMQGDGMDFQAPSAAEAPEVPKQKVSLNRAKFRSMMGILSSEVKRREDRGDDSVAVGDLIQWYLDNMDFESVEALGQERRVARAVVNQMINKERVLIVVEGASEGSATGDRRLVILHPNYVLE